MMKPGSGNDGDRKITMIVMVSFMVIMTITAIFLMIYL